MKAMRDLRRSACAAAAQRLQPLPQERVDELDAADAAATPARRRARCSD